MAPDTNPSATADSKPAAKTRKRAKKTGTKKVARPTLVHGKNVPLFQTPEQAAKGEHPHTNIPRREEIKALAPAESPSNAHKTGMPNALETVHPLSDGKGPIANTAMGHKAANKKQKARSAKLAKAA